MKRLLILALITGMTVEVSTAFASRVIRGPQAVVYQRWYMELVHEGLSHQTAACVAEAMLFYPASDYATAGFSITGSVEAGVGDPTGSTMATIFRLEQSDPCGHWEEMEKNQRDANRAEDIRMFGSEENARRIKKAGGCWGGEHIPAGAVRCDDLLEKPSDAPAKKPSGGSVGDTSKAWDLTSPQK